MTTELVLPFVIRIERDTPPARTDALEAAARGVLLMLTVDEPRWQESIEQWDGQRIRKVVRRARGAHWDRAAELPGLTVRHRTAQVRVYPPIPTDAWPPELSRLQVGGTELTDPVPPEPPDAGEPLILISPLVAMTAGKAMAQAAHAAQLGWRSSTAPDQVRWRADSFPLAVRTATPAQWRDAVAQGVPVVHDGGFTEVEPDTQTAAALLPWDRHRSDS